MGPPIIVISEMSSGILVTLGPIIFPNRSPQHARAAPQKSSNKILSIIVSRTESALHTGSHGYEARADGPAFVNNKAGRC